MLSTRRHATEHNVLTVTLVTCGYIVMSLTAIFKQMHRYKCAIMWKCYAYEVFSTCHLQYNNINLVYTRQSRCRHNGMTTHTISTKTVTSNKGDGMNTVMTNRDIHLIIAYVIYLTFTNVPPTIRLNDG